MFNVLYYSIYNNLTKKKLYLNKQKLYIIIRYIIHTIVASHFKCVNKSTMTYEMRCVNALCEYNKDNSCIRKLLIYILCGTYTNFL